MSPAQDWRARSGCTRLGPWPPASFRDGRPPVLGMVTRQCLGWSPASSGVGRPPILRPSARQASGWSPTRLRGAGRCQRPKRTDPPGASVLLYRLARRPCPRSRGRGLRSRSRGLMGDAYYTASPGAPVLGREAAASRGMRMLLPRQAPLSPIEKPRPHTGCVLYCLARRPCPRWTSRGLPGDALSYTASPGTRVPGREAAAFQGTLGYSASPGAPVPGRAAATSGRHQPPGRASAPLDRGVAGVDEPETLKG